MSRLPAIVTRGQPGAALTMRHLFEARFRPVLSPVLSFEATEPAPALDLRDASGLIFTSANGVRFFCERSARRDLVAWCVGTTTEAAAAEAGFDRRHNADGDADDLFQLISARAQPADGRLVHVANAAAAGQLAERLREAGFAVDFAPLYEARPARSLSEAANTALATEPSGLVVIHSAKGAEAFAPLMGDRAPTGWGLVAISDRAAAPVQDLGWKITELARHPSEDGIIGAARRARDKL